jgi:hypothetical protein
MPDDPIGEVTLDAVQFTTTPRPYESAIFAKRGSVHQVIAGSSDPGIRVQDFGRRPGDLRLELGSGESQFLDTETVRAIDALVAVPLGQFLFVDWLGNELVVFFPPGDEQSFHPTYSQIAGLWRYTMKLRCLAINRWLGGVFAG